MTNTNDYLFCRLAQVTLVDADGVLEFLEQPVGGMTDDAELIAQRLKDGTLFKTTIMIGVEFPPSQVRSSVIFAK